MPEKNEVQLQGAVDGATLALQAKKEVSLFRLVQVKISNLTGIACDIKDATLAFRSNVSAELAKVAYMAEFPLPAPDDAGTWTVSCVKQKMNHCGD